MEKSELTKLKNSLKGACLIYSDYENEKRCDRFGEELFGRLNSVMNYGTLYDGKIVYEGAQWGGKWGNYYHAIYYRKGEFFYGAGYSDEQILNY